MIASYGFDVIQWAHVLLALPLVHAHGAPSLIHRIPSNRGAFRHHKFRVGILNRILLGWIFTFLRSCVQMGPYCERLEVSPFLWLIWRDKLGIFCTVVSIFRWLLDPISEFTTDILEVLMLLLTLIRVWSRCSHILALNLRCNNLNLAVALFFLEF